jgi:1,2-beta-oligoglucan phosphorylase
MQNTTSSKNPFPKNFPHPLQSPSGLKIEVNANGSIRRMDHGDILLNLFLGTEIEGGPANLYLRRHGTSIEVVPLLGPQSPAAIHLDERGISAGGEWHGIHFRVSLVLAESTPAWFWHLRLENTLHAAVELDLFYAQDLALAHYGAVRINEYYTSHYVDHTPLSHPERGIVLASRQNLSMSGRQPWCVIGALGKGVGFASDALQFNGLATRAGQMPVGLTEGLDTVRRQHEHAMAVIQDAPMRLGQGEVIERGFFGWFEADHPEATSADDLVIVDNAMGLPEAVPAFDSDAPYGTAPSASLFTSAPLLDSQDLTEAEIANLFGTELRAVERQDGKILSFFTGTNRHVVLKAKELSVLRPHMQILRTGHRLIPEEAALTSNTWMGGVFHAMVTQGHVSINRFLSTPHSYLSFFRGNGLRLFVEMADGWHLLDVPSAFEMTPESSRWIYKHPAGLIDIRSGAPVDRHELTFSAEVLNGAPLRFLLSWHVALDGENGSSAVPVRYVQNEEGVFVQPLPESDVGRRFPEGGFRIVPLDGTVMERIGRDEMLYADGLSRKQPYLCMISEPAVYIGFRLEGCLISEDLETRAAQNHSQFWTDITGDFYLHPPIDTPLSDAAKQFGEILPWFIQNTLIHYLAPRGPEQFTGGGWGTRDISQGPVELFLGLGRHEPIREILIRLFKAQNPEGDWPQWFTFFDRERNIRAGDSHGDIVFWPLLALAQYLVASEDGTLLDEIVPFFHPEEENRAEKATLWHHVERALAVIGNRLIPGYKLAAYGHGDWNDSMQPADPTMRARLCSAWTVTLHYQTLNTLAAAFKRLGRSDQASQFAAAARDVHDQFQRHLLMDGTVTGYAYFHDGDRIDYLLHPRDKATGVSYSLLPMIHAIINDLLTPEQARKHLDIIKTHLLGPDGARLFDRPMEYRGGPQKRFQRAESASFFGREIGLMYTHAHLRYAEALARYGDAEGFFLALCQANPIGIRSIVPAATLRQANCYYSSSDGAFADRYEAFLEYDRVKRGAVPLDGGWRVYSSGPGIWTRLMLQSFLGLRWERSALMIDPVIPKVLSGLQVEMKLGGISFEVTYHIEGTGCGTKVLRLNGGKLPFERSENPYRIGAARVPMATVGERLTKGTNQLAVDLD